MLLRVVLSHRLLEIASFDELGLSGIFMRGSGVGSGSREFHSD